jgi:hypothetical protein
MRERFLALCLLAYPRARRARDGGYLIDLALDLAERSGPVRQGLSLVRGGLLERLRGIRRGPALLAAGAMAAVLAVGGVAVAAEGSVQVEVQTCAPAADHDGADDAGCEAVEAWAADRASHGWQCDLTSSRREVSWRCTRP